MIYKQVVLPGLTYGVARWKEPAEKGNKQNQLISCLGKIQNKCLRVITGAHRATPVEMLHNEAQILPMRVALERIVLRSSERSETGPVSQVIKQACAAIREKLWGGRRRRVPNIRTRSDRIAGWAKQERERTAGADRGGDWTKTWAQGRWKGGMEEVQGRGARAGASSPGRIKEGAAFKDPQGS